MDTDSTPGLIRQEVRSAPSGRSIWTSVQDETNFRQAAVDLALTTSECPWDADVGLPPLPGSTRMEDYIDAPESQSASQQSYILAREIEQRLANDFALLAASREAVFSVTAACIQEKADYNGDLVGLKLLLAANEGVSRDLQESLAEIWQCLTNSTSEAETVERIFTKIVHMNRLRIYQRVRKSVGHPPIFREKGRTRKNPDDKLSRAFTRMPKSRPTEKWKPPEKCHELVGRGLALNDKLLALLENLSVDEIEQGSDDIVHQLKSISRDCFNVTTDHGRIPFKHLLIECGLDAHLWLKNKYVGEVDKIGAYWRIATSLFKIHAHLSRNRPRDLPPIHLEIEGVRPYVSVTNEPSIQHRPMPCYVHAEVQLITYLAQHTSLSHERTHPPRIIGASKSACFLCFLFLECYQGPKAPATHGRLYDQWTVPDLEGYTDAQVQHLRETLVRMWGVMVRLKETYGLKKHRDHPMTSRVDIDRLSLFSAVEGEKVDARGEGDEEGEDDCAGEGAPRGDVEGVSKGERAVEGAGKSADDIANLQRRASSPQEEEMKGLRALLERCWIKIRDLGSANK